MTGEEREDMELSELFRNKLDKALIAPDPSVNLRLMKRLDRREFVTFNPARFNIYYLGALAAAGVTAVLMLLSADEPLVSKSSEAVGSEIKVTVSSDAYQEENEISTVKELTESLPVGKVIRAGTEKQAEILKETNHAVVRDQISIEKSEIQNTTLMNEILKADQEGCNELVGKNKGYLKFGSSATEGCVPLKVKFVSPSAETDSCVWKFDNLGTIVGRTAEWTFADDGEYKVTLEIYTSGVLDCSASETIRVNPRPVAGFEIIPEDLVIPDDEIRFHNYSTGAVSYSGDFGDGSYSEVMEPFHSDKSYGSYDGRLTVINEYGCTDSVIVSDAFSGSRYFIEFPNAFIPNPNGPSGGNYTSKSDESAHVFHPSYSGVVEYQLKIFSKMGILVFESNDISVGWDGYFKGQLSNSGVYVWKVRGKFRNGEPFLKMGDITLLQH